MAQWTEGQFDIIFQAVDVIKNAGKAAEQYTPPGG